MHCVVILAVLGWGGLVSAKAPYCLPHDECFPSAEAIGHFNESVHGALIQIHPYGRVCYEGFYDAEACRSLADLKENSTYRELLPGASMYTNWEQSEDLSGCPVPDPPEDGTAPPPVAGNCTLGGMPYYVVNVSTVDDIVKSVEFSSKYNLRLRIKNSGHDYTGRSTGDGSFTIWTLHMKDTVLLEEFTPENDSSSFHKVLSAGPGLNVGELYQWGAENGVVTIGGFVDTVGATGGYLLGGGLGPLGPHLGMAVDNVLQYEVVTADGKVTYASDCSNTDLFWALRGGGGAFGVITRVWLKTYPFYPEVTTIAGQITCANFSSYTQLINTLVDLQVPTRNAGHTGIWETTKSDYSVSLLNIVVSESEQPSSNHSADILQPLLEIPGCLGGLQTAQFTGSSSWYEAFEAVIRPAVQPGSLVGVNLADFSRIISYDDVSSSTQMDRMKQFILDLPHPFIWQNTVGNVTTQVAEDATAVHPAWRNAFAYLNVPVFGPWSGVTETEKFSWLAVRDNATRIFGTAAYYNEDYEWEASWEDSMFGENYKRLDEIKKAWDPQGVFSCRNCVGSENGY